MKINAISGATFGSKQQIVKKAAAGFMAAAGTGLAADTFVKGLSKPNKAFEDEIIRGNDEGDNCCDPLADEFLSNSEQAKQARKNDGCGCY